MGQDYHWQWGIGPRDERPTWINLSWRNVRVQTAKTVVTAGADVVHGAIRRPEADIQAAREQEEARRLARQTATMEKHL